MGEVGVQVCRVNGRDEQRVKTAVKSGGYVWESAGNLGSCNWKMIYIFNINLSFKIRYYYINIDILSHPDLFAASSRSLHNNIQSTFMSSANLTTV